MHSTRREPGFFCQKKSPACILVDRAIKKRRAGLLQRHHVFRLRALYPLADRELHLLSFLEGLAPIHLDGAKMDEYIAFTFPRDETETLCIVEPLHGSRNLIRHRIRLTLTRL